VNSFLCIDELISFIASPSTRHINGKPKDNIAL